MYLSRESNNTLEKSVISIKVSDKEKNEKKIVNDNIRSATNGMGNMYIKPVTKNRKKLSSEPFLISFLGLVLLPIARGFLSSSNSLTFSIACSCSMSAPKLFHKGAPSITNFKYNLFML